MPDLSRKYVYPCRACACIAVHLAEIRQIWLFAGCCPWHVVLAFYQGADSLQAVTAVMCLSCFMAKHQAALSLFRLQLLPLRAMSGLDNHQPL